MKPIYDAESIKVFEGLSAVRKRPAMYIGSTNSYGLHHLLWEILDNSMDEILNNFGTFVKVTLYSDNYISVEDDGRGIPVDINKKYKKSAVNLIFEKLHSGGKFNSSVYKTSGGLHGVGAAVVNALSESVDIKISRNHKLYETAYINGGKLIKPLKTIGKSKTTGTFVKFKPDPLIFKKAAFIPAQIEKILKQKAYLNKNANIIFENKLTNETKTWNYKDGITDYINDISKSYEKLFAPVYFKKTDEKDIFVEIVWTYAETNDEYILSFANNIETINGGTHVTGFKYAITKTINDFAIEHKFIKENNRFNYNDIKEGLIAIVSIKLSETYIQFEGQTKTKLGSPIARKYVEHNFSNYLYNFLVQNKEKSTLLIKQILLNQKTRKILRSEKERLKNRKSILKDSKILSGKLVPCISKKSELSELFLVEGDSAGGTAKSARDRNFQAILPLKGKILNVLRSSEQNFSSNIEINTIINALECGIEDSFDINHLRYNKIIIMTDADTDGAHIQALLLTFFWKLMKDIIYNNNLYIAIAPLYKAVLSNKQKVFFWSDNELNERKKKESLSFIQRFKGLGEMNADELWATTMDPKMRKLEKITIHNAKNAKEKIEMLMGDDAYKRKSWIDKHIDFELESNDGKF